MEKELVSLKELGVTGIDLRSMGGTDHLSFEKVDVPGFAVRQDPAEYRFTHHSQSDTLDKASEPDLIQGTQVMAVAALRVANLPELLPRDKPAGSGQSATRQRPRRRRRKAPPAKSRRKKEVSLSSLSRDTQRSANALRCASRLTVVHTLARAKRGQLTLLALRFAR